MFKLKRLNASGVAHHAVLMLVVVLAVAGFGFRQVLLSHADALNTADYTLKVTTENGCWLAGRVWQAGAAGGSQAGTCTSACRVSSTTFVGNGTAPGYCSGQVSVGANPDTCVVNQHRMYIYNLGCARKANQDSSNNSRDCTGWSGYANKSTFANYVADYYSDGGTDKCIAATVAPTPPPTNSGGNSTPTTDAITNTYCKLLGRTIATQGSCNRECQAGQTLLVNTDKVYYCNLSIANMTPASCSATFRVYVVVDSHNIGCARRSDQLSTTDNLRCQTSAGYTYYKAVPGGIDSCLKSAPAPVTCGIITLPPGSICPPTLTGGGNNGGTGDTNGGSTNGGGTVTSAPQAGSGTAVHVEAISRTTCDLLGREWVPASKAKDGTKQAAGCSTESCFKSKIDIHKSNGSYYCDGYATKQLDQQKCSSLHRKWVDAVQACASRPNQSNKPGTRVIKAPQCVGSYATYIFRTAQYDECLKPGTVDNLKNVARVSGLPFVKVTTLSRAGLCNALPHKHWNGHACVQDRQVKSATSNNGSSKPIHAPII